MCTVYRATGNAGSSAEPKFHTLPAGLRIGRNTGDANSQLTESPLQDFTCENGSTGAWFSTDLDTESPNLTINLDQFNLQGYDQSDGLEQCLAPYPGITTLYRVNDDIRLWDMSMPSTISFIRAFLTSEANALDKCFRHDADHDMVVRHSTLRDDIALCRVLVDRGLFSPLVPGWYHPTMCVFNEDDMHIERIHRREIVLINFALITRIGRTFDGFGAAGVSAPMKPKPPRIPSRSSTNQGRKLFG